MRVLFSADWHIKLGQRNVPKAWQIDRFVKMVEKLNTAAKGNSCDIIVLGGDIFDRFDPTTLEIELYFNLISKLEVPTLIFTGNHEMVSKTDSVLFHLAEETNRCNPNVEVVTQYRSTDFDIIDYAELHKAKWKQQKSKLCFTHVRGTIEPHVVPEIDLAKFDCYDMVIAGDLHSFKNTQHNEKGIPIVYPGSPLTTSFHRERTTGTNGYLVIDTKYMTYCWYELGDLPQLIRKTISAGEEMIPDEYDRVIYEVEGDISELKGIKDSELLDKRVNKNVGREATLDLSNSTGISSELRAYYINILGLKNSKVKNLIKRFKKVIPNAD